MKTYRKLISRFAKEAGMSINVIFMINLVTSKVSCQRKVGKETVKRVPVRFVYIFLIDVTVTERSLHKQSL